MLESSSVCIVRNIHGSGIKRNFLNEFISLNVENLHEGIFVI